MDTLKIGRFIAMCRKEKGITQAQLGEKLGVTAKTISRWENGNYMPDLSLLQPISEELGVSLNELLSGERLVQNTIQQEELLQKTEHSLIGTLQYATEQIKQLQKKTVLAVLVLICCFVVVLLFLNRVIFAEIPHHEGDVSQWASLFPNHSAYELAIGETGEPVFIRTDKALSKVKIDCSDAISVIRKTYDLPALTRYSYQKYQYYAKVATLLFRGDERVMAQRQLLIDFLDIYDNSYEWEEFYNSLAQKEDVLTEGSTPKSTESVIEVFDNTNVDYEVITYEKEIDMTADGVADRIVLIVNVTEPYQDAADTCELLSYPFVGRVALYDGASKELMWERTHISSDRIGNYQISIVTRDGAHYLLVGETQEQMGDGYYYYRVFSFEGWQANSKKGDNSNEGQENIAQTEDTEMVWEMQLVDSYHVNFVLDYAGYRLFPDQLLREEAVADYKAHIEEWLVDSELIVATDVMMEYPYNVLGSSKEQAISAKEYYDKVWARVTDQTEVFQFVCPEIKFPEDETWVQNLICFAADEQMAIAKYYDAKAEGNCVFSANVYTEKELREEIEYAWYLHGDRVKEHQLAVEMERMGNTDSEGNVLIEKEVVNIYGYEIPFENAEYKDEVKVFWEYNDKVYMIFANLSRDADITSVMEMAEYMVLHLP